MIGHCRAGFIASATFLALFFGWLSTPSYGVLVLTTPGASPTVGRNLAAPSGGLLNSGWQYQGTWGAYLGTPIASKYFITAKHVLGNVGDSFTLNSVSYTTDAKFDSPTTDLTIWRITGTFSPTEIAPLYTNTNELNKPLVVYGRGTAPGSLVTVSSNPKGWTWGANDAQQSWGENVVELTPSGGAGIGDLLEFAFDNSGSTVANEAALSLGDSGGGVFIFDGSVWKLAGINFGVDAFFNFTGTNGNGFNASIFDARGLYFGNDIDGWTLISGASNQPGSSYSTRISSNVAWINTVVPEPTGIVLNLIGLLGLFFLVVKLRNRRNCAAAC